MIKLYDFQEKINIDTRNAMIKGHRRIIVQSPTGSGKTVMFSKNVLDAEAKNKKCLIITDRIELLTGTDNTLIKFGINATSILAGQKLPPENYSHCIAMSQTLRLRLNNPEWRPFLSSFDLVIIDEAHVQEFNIYFESDAFINNPFILGYTATPIRLRKQRKLSSDYTFLIEGPQIQELINKGFLVKDKYYAPKQFDVNGLSVNSFGDYQEADMFKKFKETVSYESIINNWSRIAYGSITLVFCVNIEHSLDVCEAFNKSGIDAKFIVSPLNKPRLQEDFTKEQFIRYREKIELYNKYVCLHNKYSGNREQIIKSWKSNEFKVLVNTGIYTKGFDYKAIETVMTIRATTSESLWLQMIGRGSRIYKDKTHFNILDFGSNAERLGLYAQERKFTLEHSNTNSSSIAPVKECGVILGKKKTDKYGNIGCGCLILASRRICNYCGYVFEQEIKEIEINLVHIDYLAEDRKEDDFAKLERRAEERGYKQGWVINNIIADGGLENLLKYANYKNYKNGWIYSIEKRYEEAIRSYNKKARLKLEKEKSNKI